MKTKDKQGCFSPQTAVKYGTFKCQKDNQQQGFLLTLSFVAGSNILRMKWEAITVLTLYLSS